VLAVLQAGVAVGFAVTISLFPGLPAITTSILGADVITSFTTSVASMLLKATIILLPPVIFLGAIFPMAAVLYSTGRRDLGASIGRIYAANTLGAIVGSLGCAFVLIPWLGMWQTQKLLVALSLLGASATAVAAVSGTTARASVAAAGLVSVVVALALAPPDVFRATFLQKGMNMDFYEEGATDTVAVQSAWGQRTIVYEDQRGTASTGTYGVNFFLGHLPMLLHPGEPKRVLHICFGVGNSLSAVAAHEELERVDNVELSPHALSAGPLFWSNDNVLEHPKVRTIIDDGRNYLMTTSETYDVILLEPPETFTAGVINLYTTEFYRDALARLAPGGIMMQWVPTANGPIESEKELFRAFSDVFPHSTMWWQLDAGCALLVGTREPLTIDYQKLRRHLEEPRVRQDMALSRVRDVNHLLSFFVFDEKAFAEFVKDARPTRDDHTVLDFTMPRYAGSGFGLGQFNRKVRDEGRDPFVFALQRRKFYLDQRRSVLPLLTNLGDASPQSVQADIEKSRDLPTTTRMYNEADWRRMREEGTIPQPPPAPAPAAK
ncbi:MAG: spermidine synthase, partial [Candidatus Binatia bacterium]